jgi:DNA mismatch repair protein MutS2
MTHSTGSGRAPSMHSGRAKRKSPPPAELDLHALTTDEALIKVNQYLNDAVMAGMFQVCIVHGKGSGTLRDFVRRELSRHPLVRSFRQADKFEGGAGATVVQLT